MSELTLSKKIKQLPPDARREVQELIDRLYKKYGPESGKETSDKKSISDSPVFGMWKDREEMEDSGEWIKGVRKKHWSSK